MGLFLEYAAWGFAAAFVMSCGLGIVASGNGTDKTPAGLARIVGDALKIAVVICATYFVGLLASYLILMPLELVLEAIRLPSAMTAHQTEVVANLMAGVTVVMLFVGVERRFRPAQR